MNSEQKQEYGLFLIWALTIIAIAWVTWFSFAWSIRAIDLRWCQESAIEKVGDCDPPAKIVRDGDELLCKCH